MYKATIIFNSDVTFDYDGTNIHIIDSYLVTDKNEMRKYLEDFKQLTNFKTDRTIDSWIKEWRTHNILYNLHLFRSHTKDCDLNNDESKFRLFCYNIIGRF